MKKIAIFFFLFLAGATVQAQSKRYNDSLYVYFRDSKNQTDSVYIAKPYESQGLQAIQKVKNAKDNQITALAFKIFFTFTIGYITLKNGPN